MAVVDVFVLLPSAPNDSRHKHWMFTDDATIFGSQTPPSVAVCNVKLYYHFTLSSSSFFTLASHIFNLICASHILCMHSYMLIHLYYCVSAYRKRFCTHKRRQNVLLLCPSTKRSGACLFRVYFSPARVTCAYSCFLLDQLVYMQLMYSCGQNRRFYGSVHGEA